MKLYRLICMELPSDILYLVKLCWQNCIGTYKNIKPFHHEQTDIYKYIHTNYSRVISNSHSTEKRRMHKNHREIMMNHFCAC